MVSVSVRRGRPQYNKIGREGSGVSGIVHGDAGISGRRVLVAGKLGAGFQLPGFSSKRHARVGDKFFSWRSAGAPPILQRRIPPLKSKKCESLQPNVSMVVSKIWTQSELL